MFEFYVYIYLNPLKNGNYKYGKFVFDYEPFYVGKGKGYRYKEHILEIRKNREKNYLKKNILNKIKNNNKEPIIIKLYDNITENSAFRLERFLINLIGRRDLDKGTLSNMSDGGEGCSGVDYTYNRRLNMCDNKQKIIQYNTNGEIIKIWNNIIELSIKNTKYRTNHIHRACKSNGSRKYDKYLWKYYENEKENDIIKIRDKYKHILQYNKEGNFIKEWFDSKDAEKVYGNAILKCCRNNNNNNNIKYHYKDYMWYFKDNNISEKIESYYKNPSLGNSVRKEKINMYSLNDEFLGIYSPRELKLKGFLTKTIYRCCNGELNTTQGYKWKWE